MQKAVRQHNGGDAMIRLLMLAMLVIAGCAGGQPAVTSAPAQAPTEAPVIVTVEPTEIPPTEAPTAAPTPTGPAKVAAGTPAIVNNNGAAWAQITVSKVRTVKKYTSADYEDVPATKGNVFIEALVTYEALQNGVEYNVFDWQVFVDGEAVSEYTTLLNGPKPTLESGTLPLGRKASGYVVFEVPPRGEVLLSYGDMFNGEAPIFEFVLRPK